MIQRKLRLKDEDNHNHEIMHFSNPSDEDHHLIIKSEGDEIMMDRDFAFSPIVHD